MKTALALLMTYEKPILTLENVAELMGIGSRSLENKIYSQECPVPMFKVGSKWHCHVNDLANYIDTQREQAINGN
jgi:hypothetical protein